LEFIEKRKKEMKDCWDPFKIEGATSDPFKTLFVSNLVSKFLNLEL
jgi:hypothetical protein